MTKGSLVALAVSFATVLVFLTVLEVLRRKGMDPVSRIADLVAPPMMAPTTPTVTSSAASAATAAINGATSA